MQKTTELGKGDARLLSPGALTFYKQVLLLLWKSIQLPGCNVQRHLSIAQRMSAVWQKIQNKPEVLRFKTSDKNYAKIRVTHCYCVLFIKPEKGYSSQPTSRQKEHRSPATRIVSRSCQSKPAIRFLTEHTSLCLARARKLPVSTMHNGTAVIKCVGSLKHFRAFLTRPL